MAMSTLRRRVRAALRACLREACRSLAFASWWFPPSMPLSPWDRPDQSPYDEPAREER